MTKEKKPYKKPSPKIKAESTKGKGISSRPTVYTKDVFDEICQFIVEGQSLRKTLKLKHMPAARTFYRWIRENQDICLQYETAKKDRADTLAEEILEIADKADAINCQVARLRVDARKWIASKHHPRNYGDKSSVEHLGEGGGAIKFESLNGISDEQLKMILDATTKKEVVE